MLLQLQWMRRDIASSVVRDKSRCCVQGGLHLFFMGGANALGSENRDRGGIQRYSEPTSPAAPLLKININCRGCSGLSNALKTSRGGGGEHRKNRNASTRNDATSPKLIGFQILLYFQRLDIKGFLRAF